METGKNEGEEVIFWPDMCIVGTVHLLLPFRANDIVDCAGYAQAFYRLCRDAGISCWYCRGTVPDGRHAWNMLDTEAGTVYIDVTWYDTDKLDVHYLDGKEQYLFMTQEDFEYYGYVQESCP